jgi:AraC family transcriptional regulator of adaptative response/methylated-DNA-[protein]-cysteine methyltransferase
MHAITLHDAAEAGRHYRQMGRAIRYLADHYLEQPSLEEAASTAGLSPYHFQRLFTRYIGVSPKNFVGHLTLGHAKAALASGSSVLGAALDSGLSGPSRLHDLCLKIEAMTPGDYARGGAGLAIDYAFQPCPFGTALLMATDRGLCGLAFADDGDENSVLNDMKARWPNATYRESNAHMCLFAERIFDADRRSDVPIGLHLLGTPWQIKVWEALLAIPSGSVTTYHAIARAMHNEKASRAVGTAVGRNPISYLIPCHRVLGSDGALHGYHWGVSRKRAMLAVEAARAAA